MSKRILLCLMTVSFVWGRAQVKDSIGTQEVTVIKSYTPSLQDVFKLRESPMVLDSILSPKKPVDFEIFSVPVASTFIPSKGTPRKLQPKKTKPQFNSKGSLGFGNFNQLLMEYSTNYALDSRQKLDWMVFYNGLLKNIKEVQLETLQSNLLLNVSHQYATSKRKSFSKINFRQHKQSFYGLREPLTDAFVLENIDPQQKLNYLSISSTWQWYDPWVKKLALHSYLTTDKFGTTEVEVDFSTKIQTLLGGVAITLLPEVTYLSTTFKEDFYSREQVDYTSGNARVSLFASKINGNFKFKVGAQAALGIGDEFEENNLFIYPELALSYLPKKGNFAPFLNLNGRLEQNSFRAFTHENPYTAPGIALKASSVPIEAQLGTRSKFFSGWEFQWNIFYAQNEQLPLYRNFGYELDRVNIVPYRYGNAFETVYAAINSTGVEAQLSAAFKNGGRLQFKTRFSDYAFENENDTSPEASVTPFNLPALALFFNGTLKVGQKIYAQWYIKHMGERKNAYRNNFLGQDLRNAPVLIEDLPAFTQMDVNLQYQLDERWEIFIKGNNLLNEKIYQWSNYPVYGTQILLGLRYNFDLAF